MVRSHQCPKIGLKTEREEVARSPMKRCAKSKGKIEYCWTKYWRKDREIQVRGNTESPLIIRWLFYFIFFFPHSITKKLKTVECCVIDRRGQAVHREYQVHQSTADNSNNALTLITPYWGKRLNASPDEVRSNKEFCMPQISSCVFPL